MTFAKVGTLGTKPGKRDEVVAILTRRSPELSDVGCLPLLSGEMGGSQFSVVGSPLRD